MMYLIMISWHTGRGGYGSSNFAPVRAASPSLGKKTPGCDIRYYDNPHTCENLWVARCQASQTPKSVYSVASRKKTITNHPNKIHREEKQRNAKAVSKIGRASPPSLYVRAPSFNVRYSYCSLHASEIYSYASQH